MDYPTITVGGQEPEVRVADVPHRIGRHVVIEVIGRGGMGVVYSAFDPDLGRRLAIKLLRPCGEGSRAAARMLREAQALARLSHPHVIQVYDVGTYHDRVYVAMELVEGQTLRTWMDQQPQPWPAVREMFLKAGRGLAAAHAAGLVHRDFKPDNVLVGDDGWVRVADFGLAIEPAADTSPLSVTELERLDDSGVVRALAGNMTETGMLVGTPAYMAAEQWMGRAIDARTDQFAFCVCLYEALTGRRPFQADSRPELAMLVTREHHEPLPSSIPAWLRRVVERGLRADPTQRYPGMTQLLAELAYDPGRRRRRLMIGGAALALVVGGAWAGAQFGHRPDPCQSTTAAMDPVWNEARRAELEQAVAATELAYAAQTWERVAPRLDAYVEDWRASRIEACAATQLRNEQSDAMMDLRMACLDRRREAVAAMLDVAAEADARIVSRLPAMVDGLPVVAVCDDRQILQRRARGEVDPARADEYEAHRAELARVVALHHAARYSEAQRLADSLVEPLDVGGWERLRAELDTWRARTRIYQGDLEQAEALAMEAYLGAVRSRHDAEAVRSAILMVTILNDREGQIDQAEQFWKRAEAEWVRAGRDPRDSIHLLNARAGLEFRRARYDQARRYSEEAVEQARAAGQDQGPNFADLLGNLGTATGQLGDLPTAEAYVREALALRERTQGSRHPDTAREIHNLGVMLAMQRRSAEAQQLFERAYEIKRVVLGEQHPDVGLALLALGNVAREQGRDEQSEGYYRRALSVLQQTLGATHPEVHYPLFNLGELMLDRDDPQAAEPLLREAVELLERSYGPEYGDLVDPLERLGQAQLLVGRPDDAMTTFERSAALRAGSSAEVPLELRYWLARARGEQGPPDEPNERLAAARTEMLALREILAAGVPNDVSPDLSDRVHRWLDEHPEVTPTP
ncbi:MAG: serine/threonine-protein kinase [Myxococcota bacterium]